MLQPRHSAHPARESGGAKTGSKREKPDSPARVHQRILAPLSSRTTRGGRGEEVEAEEVEEVEERRGRK